MNDNCNIPSKEHAMEIRRVLFKWDINLQTGDTGKENCDWEFLNVPKKWDYGVPGGCTAWKFRVYLR